MTHADRDGALMFKKTVTSRVSKTCNINQIKDFVIFKVFGSIDPRHLQGCNKKLDTHNAQPIRNQGMQDSLKSHVEFLFQTVLH